MSIRFRILTGCLTLTLLTGVLGTVAEIAQRQLGAVALDIYDNAFMAMSYLRAAQVDFAGIVASGIHARAANAADAADGADILADLDVAAGRAMSLRGHERIGQLRRQIAAALPDLARHPENAAAIQANFNTAVEIFAADGFRNRRQVQALVADQIARSRVTMGASVAAALLITALISHLIVPPVRRAVRVAQAIASGKLDNTIDARGRGETADLLRALSVMQSAIAIAMARIRALMDEQARSHAGAMADQNAQMSAALDNMNQGLCLFDATGHLRVANRRFAELFGMPAPGGRAEHILTTAGLADIAGRSGESFAALPCELADGRILAVSQQAIEGGGWVGTYEDVSERRAAERRLTHMARHDDLTGLPNRVAFQELAKVRLDQARAGAPLALFCFDIDRFRIINDTLGNAAGDALLRAVVQRLVAGAPAGAETFRLGGNEFAILLTLDATTAGAHQDAHRLAERLMLAMSEPFAIAMPPVSVNASIGMSLAADLDIPAPDTLLMSAHLALGHAKEAGGGICLFLPEMDAVLRDRHALEVDLREALAGDQFMLVYQPQVIAGRGIKGFEALMRWQHPVRGLVGPAQFIPVAEETGLIGALGDWVMRRACRDAALWPGEVKVAVNISPAQFRSRNVIDDIRRALDASNLPSSRLEVEITEAVLLADDARVLETLHGIHALGVRIAMDDFGTGYSSLGYLTRFPFDKIKIDQSFVRNMAKGTDSLAIVRAVIGLGRSLGMTVNAEGVETEEQRDLLTHEGCDELQGYLFSRPVPEAAVRDLLAKHGTVSAPARSLLPAA